MTYDYAIHDALRTLKNDVSRSGNYLKNIPVILKGNPPMRIEEIAEQINSTPEIEGVTFTGGEPLLQARDILPLAMWIKSKGLSIVCYTGYLFQEIVDGEIPYAEKLLRWLDILIDGTFQEEDKGALLWRGSCNQTVHFLTEVENFWASTTLRAACLKRQPRSLTREGLSPILR